MDGDALGLVGREVFVDLLLAVDGHDDGADAGALGGEELLLDAATGSTSPERVISPVIAVSGWTGVLVRRLTSAVAMVTPALGPSLGMAPAGT